MKLRSFLFVLFFFRLILSVNAEVNSLLLKDKDTDYFLDSSNLEIMEDVRNKWNEKDILSADFNSAFRPLTNAFPDNEHEGNVYWMRCKVKEGFTEKWLLECYNVHANLIAVYVPLQNGKMYKQVSGADLNFPARILQHINFVFFLPDLSKETTIYIKYRSKAKARIRFLIHTYSHFSNYAFKEYFFLGIFYGMIIIIGIYNLFLFLRLRDVAYLFYSLYTLFVGLYSMAYDGVGFQFVWPFLPHWNTYALFFFPTGMVVLMLLYTRSFLNTSHSHPLLDIVIQLFIVIRLVFFLAHLFVINLSDYVWIDLFAFMLAYAASILAYRRGTQASLYFVIGFSVLFLGYLVSILAVFKLLPSNVFTVYSLNGAVVIEILLLSQALAERVKQIRESEIIKGRLNVKLENMVKERTEALMIQKNIIEEKVKTLDTFIYKSSHDIQGPLKSVIGVATLGLKDNPENSKVYFRHTLIMAKKLDTIVKDLVQITYVTNASLHVEEIDFNKIVESVLKDFENFQDFSLMHLNIKNNTSNKFYSESSLIRTIFYNLIEYAFIYRDPQVSQNKLEITVSDKEGGCELKFHDNGMGIDPTIKDNIFSMFFRIDEKDQTGLRFYIVKICTEKLGGSIQLESESGQDTIFTIDLKSFIENK